MCWGFFVTELCVLLCSKVTDVDYNTCGHVIRKSWFCFSKTKGQTSTEKLFLHAIFKIILSDLNQKWAWKTCPIFKKTKKLQQFKMTITF